MRFSITVGERGPVKSTHGRSLTPLLFVSFCLYLTLLQAYHSKLLRLFRAPIWCPSGRWQHARGREHCRGEPGSALSGGYAPDSVEAEGSSIVGEPGKG